MGRDKTRLVYRDRPMALHQADKLALVCGRAALVGKGSDPFPGSGYRFIDDGAEEHAALLGVFAALSSSPEELNVILAADIPLCPEAFLAALLETAEAVPAAVIVPIAGGELQTLCSVWRKSALPALHDAIEAREFSLRRVIERLGGFVIQERETVLMPGGSSENFVNVNRPEDYENLAKGDETLSPGR